MTAPPDDVTRAKELIDHWNAVTLGTPIQDLERHALAVLIAGLVNEARKADRAAVGADEVRARQLLEDECFAGVVSFTDGETAVALLCKFARGAREAERCEIAKAVEISEEADMVERLPGMTDREYEFLLAGVRAAKKSIARSMTSLPTRSAEGAGS